MDTKGGRGTVDSRDSCLERHHLTVPTLLGQQLGFGRSFVRGCDLCIAAGLHDTMLSKLHVGHATRDDSDGSLTVANVRSGSNKLK